MIASIPEILSSSYCILLVMVVSVPLDLFSKFPISRVASVCVFFIVSSPNTHTHNNSSNNKKHTHTHTNTHTHVISAPTTKTIGTKNHWSLISLNINVLNYPIKRHRLTDWIQKQDVAFCCIKETHLSDKNRHYLRVKG